MLFDQFIACGFKLHIIYQSFCNKYYNGKAEEMKQRKKHNLYNHLTLLKLINQKERALLLKTRYIRNYWMPFFDIIYYLLFYISKQEKYKKNIKMINTGYFQKQNKVKYIFLTLKNSLIFYKYNFFRSFKCVGNIRRWCSCWICNKI